MKYNIFSYIIIIFLTLCVENSKNQDDCVTHTKENVDCSNIYANETKLLLYTRNNPTNPIEINETNVNQIEKKEKNVVIIHGYESDPSILVYPDMRKKYLQRYDSNVFMVDWSKISWECYPIGICKFPKLSKFIAKLLCEIQNQSSVSLTDFHLVGHSMGAHLSGLIGQNTIKICNQYIGRITGMDPAGPIFQLFPPIKRLDKSDALFVDIIHTNALISGYYSTCGHVDFYVNCGTNQAGCPQIDLKNISSSFLAKNSCSHIRSLIYMTESISSDNFIAQSCSFCPYKCQGDRNPEYIIMGEDCPTNSTHGVFWVPTNPTSPYGAGCSLYENGCNNCHQASGSSNVTLDITTIEKLTYNLYNLEEIVSGEKPFTCDIKNFFYYVIPTD